jgi:hypothetical protein
MSFRSRHALSHHTIIRVCICVGLIVGLVGCANTTSSLRSDAAMELAQQRQEDATYERLSHSNCNEIAEQARALARK